MATTPFTGAASFLQGYGTIGDVANKIAVKKLRRPDLLAETAEAALDAYLTICSKVPFEALQFTSAERNCTFNVATHDISDLNAAGVVSVRMTYGVGQARRLKRSHVRVYDSLSYIAASRPANYARWGDTLEFMPPPDSASYTYRIRYWVRPPVVFDGSGDASATRIVIPPEWVELLKWETLYREYWNIDEIQKANVLMMPAMLPRQYSPKNAPNFEIGIIPRLWNDLLMTINQREASDEDFSVNPVMRPYTKGGR